MAGNNIIQVLRGNNITTTAGNAVLLPGQPAYDMTTGHLYIGDESGANLANKLAINATYANEAGHADSADTASNATYASNARYASNAGRASTADTVSGYLYLNNGTSQVNWDGNENTTIYVPRTKGSSGQVWGMNGSNVGWINQTEVPGTIEHANTADSADYATSAGSATTATTANKTRYSLYLDNGSTNVAWNGSASNVIYVPTDNMVSAGMANVIAISSPAKIPVICGEAAMLDAGGLATYGIDYYELGRLTSVQASKILSGQSSPANMPIEYMKNPVLSINTNAAQELGVLIPAGL